LCKEEDADDDEIVDTDDRHPMEHVVEQIQSNDESQEDQMFVNGGELAHSTINGSTTSSYHMGSFKIDLASEDRLYQVFLRPDIAQQEIIDLLHQVLMSFGGTIRNKSYANNLNVANLENEEEKAVAPMIELLIGDSKRLTIYLGILTATNFDQSQEKNKHSKSYARILLIHVHNDFNNTITSSHHGHHLYLPTTTMSMSMSSKDLFDIFANTVFARIVAAFHSEKMSLSSISSPRKPLDSILDLYYVYDLQAAIAQETMLHLR
jgi:hypothetical protein